ncbi:uncharacterized protein LY79DRAFT_571743 [Colletotrichum navitas]|uniref:Uncharacterized protein n=1 Tax=Colletotrichum navitas TaxID=681940 RepID=A0AAD8PLT6_9PEZI|nr:uncharacterized protein LY79DRAFT_571743 [Colletotrichum navitas]KAK1569513.1 hypothetical protein LY79DRAFT_571743 [Colletotrichum navitas]
MQSAHRNVKNAKGGVVGCSRLSRVGRIPAFSALYRCSPLTVRRSAEPTGTNRNSVLGPRICSLSRELEHNSCFDSSTMSCCLMKRPLPRGLCLARRCRENQLSGTHQAACRSRLLPYLSVLHFSWTMLTIMSVNEKVVDLAWYGLPSFQHNAGPMHFMTIRVFLQPRMAWGAFQNRNHSETVPP